MLLERPKSHILTILSSARRTFLAAKSPCNTCTNKYNFRMTLIYKFKNNNKYYLLKNIIFFSVCFYRRLNTTSYTHKESKRQEKIKSNFTYIEKYYYIIWVLYYLLVNWATIWNCCFILSHIYSIDNIQLRSKSQKNIF